MKLNNPIICTPSLQANNAKILSSSSMLDSSWQTLYSCDVSQMQLSEPVWSRTEPFFKW